MRRLRENDQILADIEAMCAGKLFDDEPTPTPAPAPPRPAPTLTPLRLTRAAPPAVPVERKPLTMLEGGVSMEQLFDPAYLELVFGRTGIFANRFAGYEPREGQIALARAVSKAIAERSKLFAEAPTGTGKSIGYAVPAIWHHVNEPTRPTALIVTANIALQEQLVGKDLPMLRELLPWKFDFCLAKGRSNYVCLDRIEHADEVASDLPAFAMQIADVCAWSRESQTGDVTELPFQPDGRMWMELSVTSDQCKHKKCPHFDRCFVEEAKRRMKACGVVVTNYHLFFADMVIRMMSETASILPNHTIAILDEGHKASDIARDFFGFKLSAGSLKRLVRDTNRTAREAGVRLETRKLEDVEVFGQDLFDRALMHRKGKEYKARLKRKGELDTSEAVAALTAMSKHLNEKAEDSMLTGEHREALRKVADRAEVHAGNLTSVQELKGGNFVFFIDEERTAGGGVRASIGAKMIDVADVLASQMFAKIPSVVVTSATLTVGSHGFEHVAADLGCKSFDELVAPSPFDLSRQALLVCPANIPEPNEPEFGERVAEAIAEVVRLARGRTLALFTSYKNLDIAHRHLLSVGCPYHVLRQGDANRTALIAEFKSNVSSVLFGTASFWEGVDVPGEALSCVVIDRLPFLTPEDPVLDAVTAVDKDWFKGWMLPRAVIAFRQGFGRLIRTVNDRGVVVVLDRRLIDKPYGKSFTKGSGNVRLSRRLSDIGPFLDGLPIP